MYVIQGQRWNPGFRTRESLLFLSLESCSLDLSELCSSSSKAIYKEAATPALYQLGGES